MSSWTSIGNAARKVVDTISTADRPFGCPEDIVLDIPVPPSVNRTRKLDPRGLRLVQKWKTEADRMLMASGQYRRAARHAISGPFEVRIILSDEKCRLDADNPDKAAIDYLRRLELVANDSPKYMRRIVIEWGDAPAGCRLIVRSIT